MTFETLAYIHALLKKKEAEAKEWYITDRDYLILLKEENAPKELRSEARKKLNLSEATHDEALRALTEFEEHEWR